MADKDIKYTGDDDSSSVCRPRLIQPEDDAVGRNEAGVDDVTHITLCYTVHHSEFESDSDIDLDNAKALMILITNIYCRCLGLHFHAVMSMAYPVCRCSV
jgi:hypothetical protein